MVSSNPLLAGGFTSRKFRGTVLNDIWPEIIFFTSIAVMVTCVERFTTTSLAFSNQLLTVLGTVIGLVLGFRTTSAYDRYWEGRKLWSTISLSSRNLATIIWICVPTDRTPKEEDKDKNSISKPLPKNHLLQAQIEKASMINVIQAFSVAVKHYLRGEPGVYYKDLYPLIAFLPQYAMEDVDVPTERDDKLPLWSDDSNLGEHRLPHDPSSTEGGFKPKKRKTFDPENTLPDVTPGHIHLAPARNPPQTTFFDYFPFLMPFNTVYKLTKRIFVNQTKEESRGDGERGAWTGKRKRYPVVESIVPLEIALHLYSYYDFLLQSGLLKPSAAGAFDTNLNSLHDASIQLRRIATTPLPFAYQAHLRLVIWIYIFFLPFSIYQEMGWLNIPATMITALIYIRVIQSSKLGQN